MECSQTTQKKESGNPKVLLINGSPNKNGCTYTALDEVSRTLNQEGIDTEIIPIRAKNRKRVNRMGNQIGAEFLKSAAVVDSDTRNAVFSRLNVRKMQEIAGDYPAFIVGDFNAYYDEKTMYNTFNAYFNRLAVPGKTTK